MAGRIRPTGRIFDTPGLDDVNLFNSFKYLKSHKTSLFFSFTLLKMSCLFFSLLKLPFLPYIILNITNKMYSALSTCSVELSLFFHNNFLEHYLAILVSTICAGSHGIFTIILPFHHYFSDLNIIIGFRISLFFQLSIFIVISLVWRLRCQTGQCRKYILNCLLILCFVVLFQTYKVYQGGVFTLTRLLIPAWVVHYYVKYHVAVSPFSEAFTCICLYGSVSFSTIYFHNNLSIFCLDG